MKMYVKDLVKHVGFGITIRVLTNKCIPIAQFKKPLYYSDLDPALSPILDYPVLMVEPQDNVLIIVVFFSGVSCCE